MIHNVTFTQTSYAKHSDALPWDIDTWTVEGVEFTIQNNYQSRYYRTRHVLHFSGSDNANNYAKPGTSIVTVQQRPGAFLSPQASMISSSPQTHQPTVNAELGDVFVGETHAGPVMLRLVSGGRFADPKLEILYCPAATMDHSAFIAGVAAQRAERFGS